MKLLKHLCCAVALAAGLGGGVAAAQEHRGSFVKVGVAGVLPDESAEIRPIGGTVEITDEAVPSLILGWDFTDRIGAQLFCCLATHEVEAVGTAAGRVDLGEVTLFPPILTATYKIIPTGRWQPYVGVGVNFTHFFDEQLPSGGVAQRISYDDSVGPAVQIGLDAVITERWFVNVDVKKAWINPDVTINGAIEADVEIDPIVTFVGVGYKF